MDVASDYVVALVEVLEPFLPRPSRAVFFLICGKEAPPQRSPVLAKRDLNVKTGSEGSFQGGPSAPW